MKKSDIFKIILILIAISGNVFIMRELHKDQIKINSDRSKISKLPLASFHKFFADVKWIMYIQKLGSIELATEKNSKEFYEEASSIINLDPGFYKVYEIASLMLASKTPDLAIDILKRGQTTQVLKDDWRLYSFAGNIRQQETIFAKATENKLPKIQEALSFYREAKNKDGANQTIKKTYVKLKAQEAYHKDSNTNILVAELKEWKNYIQESSLMIDSGDESLNALSAVDPDLKQDVLSIIQQIKREAPEDLDGKELIKEMLGEMFIDTQVCKNCYFAYQAGDKYCSNCRDPVKIYGICSNQSCGKVNRNSNYCEFCGNKNVKTPPPAPKK